MSALFCKQKPEVILNCYIYEKTKEGQKVDLKKKKKTLA